MTPRRLRHFLVALLVLGCFQLVTAAECGLAVGGRAVLASDATDPNVFVWDSRERLIDYEAGRWESTRTIFAHTIMAHPGTHAVVVACYPGVARSRSDATPQDAIGIRIASGPYRGRYGWVISEDVHRAGDRAIVGR